MHTFGDLSCPPSYVSGPDNEMLRQNELNVFASAQTSESVLSNMNVARQARRYSHAFQCC
jgi:hypothetical protein